MILSHRWGGKKFKSHFGACCLILSNLSTCLNLRVWYLGCKSAAVKDFSLRDQSLIMQGGGWKVFRGAPKILGSERGATKNLESEKGGHENYKAYLSYLKRKLLPSMIFVKRLLAVS